MVTRVRAVIGVRYEMKQIFGKLILILATLVLIYGLWAKIGPAREPVGQLAFAGRSDGSQIGYYASGQGPRVMLLASLGRSVSDFNELVPRLNTAGYRTIAVEMRGVGVSIIGKPRKQLTLFTLADDAVAAMSADGVDGDDMVFGIGHAFGNRVIRAVATRYPDNVGGLVLIAAGGAQKLEPDQRITQALINAFDWRLSPPKRRAEIRYGFFAGQNQIPDFWLDGWHAKAAKLQIDAVRNTSLVDWHAGGGLAPMLVLQGDQDRIAPAATTSVRLHQDFPDRVQIVTISPAGHAILPERDEAVANAIISFLDQQSAELN